MPWLNSKTLKKEMGDLNVVESGILVDLLLSYRDVSAWQEMELKKLLMN